MADKILSGTDAFDYLLEGGYEKDIVTTIYGPAGSGKTTFCLLAAIHLPKDKKILFIDTEGGFSVSRLSQLMPDSKLFLERIFFLKPTNFEEQKQTFQKVSDMVNQKFGLIIVDTISSLYRVERGVNNGEDIYDLNRELGKQIGLLVEISRKKDIPVLLTNQVYADFEDKTRVSMVGGDILKYGSKCLIELQSNNGHRKAILRKHRSLPEREVEFKIEEKGIFMVKESKGFKLF